MYATLLLLFIILFITIIIIIILFHTCRTETAVPGPAHLPAAADPGPGHLPGLVLGDGQAISMAAYHVCICLSACF